MPWFGQPAKIDGNDIVDGVIKGATAVMSLSKMKREREMEEVRFAQEQHEFKQKDEAFDQNKRSAALQMQGQEYQNVVLRNKATQTALQTAWETDNEEAMTKFMMLAYKMTSGNLYEDPTLQNEMSSILSGNPRLLKNEQMMGIFEMMTDGTAALRDQQSEAGIR
jgi:predicted RNase H-like nuclease (RuvC/YqgF family)